jgi:chloramphenicol-sensitive protein RarD
MHNKGTLAALGAYFLWGLFPIYWKFLDHVPASEILAHRMLWSFVFMLLLMAIGREWRWLKTAVSQPRVLLLFVLSATLLGINWLTYIWGVNNGYIVDTSLGYFINPLVNVLLGVLFLRERPRNGQWLAIGVATIGVVYLAVSYGVVLWISLTLAFSFAFYGLLRKTSSLNSWEGLTLETAVFFLPAFGYLLFLEVGETAAFGHISTSTTLLLHGHGHRHQRPLAPVRLRSAAGHADHAGHFAIYCPHHAVSHWRPNLQRTLYQPAYHWLYHHLDRAGYLQRRKYPQPSPKTKTPTIEIECRDRDRVLFLYLYTLHSSFTEAFLCPFTLTG